MSTIGSVGKLDVATMVSQLVAADRAPTDARYARSERQLTAQVSAIGVLRNAFAGLNTAVDALTSSGAAQARKVTLPADANFAASAATGAAVGRYQVEVLALATNHKLASTAFSADAAVGTGQLTLAAGDITLTVDIDQTNNTLAGIRDAINAKDAGKTVNASIVTGDDGAHLVLTAVGTGTAGALTVTAAGGDGGLGALAYDPQGSSTMSQLVAATDARVKVDGFERTSASNTLVDVITGVSLTLTKADAGTPRELVVSADASLQRSAAKNFVAAYNAAMSAIASTTAYNSGTRVAAALNGDSMVRGVSRDLRAAVSAEVNDLKAIGITINQDGTLKLDEAAFDAGKLKDPDVTARLFSSGSDSLAGRINATAERLVDSDGLLQNRSESLAARTKTLANQRTALDFRMSQATSRYRSQFTALDKLLTSLQGSSDFLTQQLAVRKSD